MPTNNNAGDSAGQAGPVEEETAAAKAPPVRRRRWGRRLALAVLLLVVLLGVLVGLAPSIVSTQAVSGYAVSMVNDRLRGTVRVEGLSLSWGGPTTVRGVQVFDPDEREVLQVTQVTCVSGLWKLLTSGQAFGEITIDSPKVHLHLTADDQLTLAQAFESKTPPASTAGASTSTMPEPRGRVVIRDGAVQLSREGGSSYDVSDLDCEVSIDTLENIEAKLDLALADGQRLTGAGVMRELLSEGAFDLKTASGKLDLRTTGDVEIGPLADVLAPQTGLRGATNLKIDATLAEGALHAAFESHVRGLQTRQRTEEKTEPIDLSLIGQVNMTPEQMVAQTNLTGAAGNARAVIEYRFSDQPLTITADKLLAAILTGESIELPDLRVEADARVDLAALEHAVPGLLHIRPGQRITAGTLVISKLTAQGGTQPAAAGSIELKDVAAESDGRVARLEPITLGFDAGLEQGEGLKVRQADLTSTFAQVTARGDASSLQAEFRSDLTKLRREVGAVFDLETFELGGDLRGTLAVKRAGNERVDVATEFTANGLRYAAENGQIDVPTANVTHAGQITLSDGKASRYTATQTRANLNDEVLAAASGWYDLQAGALHADIDVERADLGFLARRATALGLDELSRYGGTISLQGKVDRNAADGPLLADGTLSTQGVEVDGQPLMDGATQITWNGAQLAADGKDVRLKQAKLTSGPATLTAANVHLRTGKRLELDGRIDGTADLARCLRAVALLTKMEQPPAVIGQLTVDATCTTKGDVVNLTGRGDISGLEVGAGEQAVREQRLRFEYAGAIDQKRERIRLEKTKLSSTPFSVEIAGTIDQYETQRVMALSGLYDASWKEVTTVLHEFVPATAETIIVTGRSNSRFKIKGPIGTADGQTDLKGLNTGLRVEWGSAEIYGVKLGKADLAPVLKDGQLTLPAAQIAASRGTVNLGGVLDLRGDEPVLRVSDKTPLLDQVAITPELSASLLSRINPIFLQLTRAEGLVGLRLKDVVLPLGDTLKTAGAGQGHLDLEEMRVQPGGFLAQLLSLGGLADEKMYTMTVSGLDFRIEDGRISYKDFTLTFPNDFDLKFYGSVGLDETLDLSVSLPVRPALLTRLGVKGPVAEYARVLTGSRIDIPVVGTRQQPKLDLARVDIKTLVDRAVQGAAGERAGDLLRGLLEGAGKDKDKDRRKRP